MSTEPGAGHRKDIFDVNLHVYNLISVFLTTKEIKNFIDLLNVDKGEEFETKISTLTSKKIDRKYYLVGSVAAGKSTTLEALRCFQTFEEWSGRAPPQMYLDDRKLSAKDQKIVDDFIFPQLIIKATRMARPICGIRIMDRTFLDLFAFSKSDTEVLRKAKELDRRFKDLGKRFEDGHVLFIKASEGALEERLAKGGQNPKRGFDAGALKVQESHLTKVYRPDDAAVFDTTFSTVGETAKLIAREILLKEYREFPFQDRLDEIIKHAGKL